MTTEWRMKSTNLSIYSADALTGIQYACVYDERPLEDGFMKIDLSTLVLALLFACGLLAIDTVMADRQAGLFTASPLNVECETS